MPGACRPRQMLPPPTTTAIWTPRSTTSASWRPISAVDSVLIPDPSDGANASPESLRRTRRYSVLPALWPAPVSVTFARAPLVDEVPPLSLLAELSQLVSDEPSHGNLLADLGTHLVEQLLDGLGVVLHERLLEQDVVPVERVDLPRHDLLDHLVGLAGLLRLGARVTLLLGDGVGRHILAPQPPWGGRARDMQGDVLHELL